MLLWLIVKVLNGFFLFCFVGFKVECDHCVKGGECASAHDKMGSWPIKLQTQSKREEIGQSDTKQGEERFHFQ